MFTYCLHFVLTHLYSHDTREPRQMELQIFAEIQKVDDDQRMVYGYASTTSLDSQGDIITKEALVEALPEYLKFSNIREMHQPSAVGITKSVDVDEKGWYIGAKIVDDNAWKKVKEEVYKGFSIGGKSLVKVDNTINKLRISEISLVDRPANPECVIELYKAEGIEKEPTEDKPEEKEIEKVAARDDADPKEGEDKYGDVKFADEKNKKYPIDTEEHIRAAWNYINKPKNADKYDAKDIQTIKNKILAAWKDKIGGEPPSAEKDDKEKSEQSQDVQKGMWDVAQLASLIEQVNCIKASAEFEAIVEGDNSTLPAKLKKAVITLSSILKDMVVEETKELTADTTESNEVVPVAYAENAEDIEKAGARNSRSDNDRIQKMHDLSMELGASCGGADSAKTDLAADISKLDDLQKSISKLEQEKQDLQKRVDELEALPKPPKGALKSVEKGQDINFSNPKTSSEEDEKNNENPLYLLKKAHEKPVPYEQFISK